MKQIKLIIPQIPQSSNKKESLSWTPYGQTKLHDLKVLWVDEVSYFLKTVKIYPHYAKAKISIKIFFKTNAHRDHNNFTCKEVIDAIKKNGLIEDDDYDHIGKVDVDITGRDREHPRTEITIKEVK